jgi:predicted dehydrogenase
LSSPRIRVAIVGCGDAAYRHYLPPLEVLADRVEIVGACSSRMASARRLAEFVAQWSPAAASFDSLETMLDSTRPEGVFNLTPAPAHADVTAACLRIGSSVYSEKPLAATMARADELMAAAREKGALLMCAPASAATRHVRWLSGLIRGGGLGRPTLALAQCGGMGPAAWAEYTGDPAVFYGPGVGPLLDIGIYRLHEMTTILGPVRRVQAMGAIAIPRRRVVAGRHAGRAVDVTAPDQVLVHLEFANGALGQLLASFATPATRLPWLEIHLESGSVSLSGDAFAADSPADVFVRDDAPVLGTDAGSGRLAAGWNTAIEPPPPADPFPLIGQGAAHFVACLEGREAPVLTAEHARHVLEVILAAYESMAGGMARTISTAF